MTSPADRIIVPLDVPDYDAAIAQLDRLPDVRFWKVGLQLFISEGGRVLELLKSRNTRIFLDLKLHDIPNTVAGACRSVSRFGVDLLTLHATAGRAALAAGQQALVEGANAHQQPVTQAIAVTLLTSLSSRDLAFDLKVPIELPEYTLDMALLAQESGLPGAVCSPREAAQLRRVCGSEFLLVCPGVRPTWSSSGDQRRITTPKEAIAAGANYLVIGRPITTADDPAAAFAQICQEIADA